MQKNDSNSDEIEICQNVGPHETDESVKSQAVVKFTTVQVPANFKFNRLELNTNLNLPPANWLTTSDSSHGLHQALYQSAGFASFRLGHMFPDIVGEVDVVSDAENIKKLLKMPFTSKNAISMFVHKVGNTLLLDEFDIQKYLLRRADNDWDWLRTFILEQILAYGQKEHNFCLKDKSREAIQTKNLLSKFLYHSLKQNSFNAASGGTSGSGAGVGGDGIGASARKQKIPNHQPLPITGPLLPEPKIDANVPDPKSSHDFNRNVLWTFEDIRMLIGTDMPIFGGPNRPCISLRLRDMTKPINVLTGIDYWLDNLMCNVPEVVMCYHLDGIVQKYEIIKTEDLPYLEDSKFSPRVVRNVAQNILAFLKANATKAGHTYWLFKGRNDDVVKLYDLTTLCKSQSSNVNGNDVNGDGDEKQDNPFTVPVGMLLYTVARNMKNSAERLTPKMAGNIRALLNNCIKLLPKEKYPQIVTSSHYLLSDLHVPDGIDPKCPKFDNSDRDSDTQSLYDDEDDLSTSESNSSSAEDYDDVNQEAINQINIPQKRICDTLKEFKRIGKSKPREPSPLRAGLKERCLTALKHVSAGIANLKYSNSHEDKLLKESEERAKEEEKQRILHEEQNPNMAKPHKPIPLPYETLKVRNSNSKSVDTVHSIEIDEKDHLLQNKNQIKSKKIKTKPVKRNIKNQDELLEIKPQLQPQTQLQSQSAAINFNSHRFGSWNLHLKLLLLEKACLIYATLAEHYYNVQKYGLGLKAINMAFRCQHVVLKYMNTLVSQRSCLLGRAGDFLVMIAKNKSFFDEYLRQFHEESESDVIINNELENELNGEELIELTEPQDNEEQLMLASCKCYENALEFLKNQTTVGEESEHNVSSKELLRRLGNVRNELGLTYMYWAESRLDELDKRKAEIEKEKENNEKQNVDKSKKSKKHVESHNKEKLNEQKYEGKNKKKQKMKTDGEEIKIFSYRSYLMKSYDALVRAIPCFKQIQDNENLMYVYSNLARYMRFRAHVEYLEDNADCLKKLKTFYLEVFLNYENARDAIGTRKLNPKMWDQISWELSTASFMYAKQLQEYIDRKHLTDLEIHKCILDAAQKALRLCDVEQSNPRHVAYAYRAGLLHKKIAMVHYKQFISEELNGIFIVNKSALQLGNHHMDKALAIFANLKEICDYLSLQIDRIKIESMLAEHTTVHTKKMKHLQNCLQYFLDSRWIFEENPAEWSEIEQDEELEPYKLMELFENLLQQILKTITKLVTTNKDYNKLSTLYKKMYMETLIGKSKLGEQKSTIEFAQQMKNILNRLIELQTNLNAEQ